MELKKQKIIIIKREKENKEQKGQAQQTQKTIFRSIFKK